MRLLSLECCGNPGEPARLVLVREYRVPVGGYVMGFPAGLIDPGGTPRQPFTAKCSKKRV
jgi:8-oxo-dGTP pyrophosphatase MutT (NUDIX family)